MKENEKGLIHVYFGENKGKTTAAVGLSVRVAGYGKRVVFAQFLKGRATGEIAPLEKLGIEIIRTDKNKKFLWEMTPEQREECQSIQSDLLSEVEELMKNGEQVDLLVLDEALNATSRDLLDEERLKEFVKNKPEHMELVLTGRPLPEWLIETADYITEMKKHKHPYDQGVNGREAIEY